MDTLPPDRPPAPAAPPSAAPPLPAPIFQEMTFQELLAAAPPAVAWLWHGFLAPGNVTLLTSRWKAGKTTLVAALLARLGQGGTLAGLAVHPGRAAVVSEESPEQWRLRGGKFVFGDHLRWLCRPFRGKPDFPDWLALLDHLLGLHARAPLDLAVIDPLAAFLPSRAESHAGTMLEALLPLQRLTAAGVAVLLLHHPRKQAAADGQHARGSGALSGFVDVLIEMAPLARAAAADRRRKLLAFSRFEQTPRRLLIQLDEAGSDYLVLPDTDADDADLGRSLEMVRLVLGAATGKRSRPEILEDWPPELPAPKPLTLWRWLERAVEQGEVLRDGTGTRDDPFRYWLKGREEKWNDDNWSKMSAIFGEEFANELRAKQEAEEKDNRPANTDLTS